MASTVVPSSKGGRESRGVPKSTYNGDDVTGLFSYVAPWSCWYGLVLSVDNERVGRGVSRTDSFESFGR